MLDVIQVKLTLPKVSLLLDFSRFFSTLPASSAHEYPTQIISYYNLF